MSVKKNLMYNSILSISSYVFPILTFPYASRILGVNNMGTYNFIDNIVNYFITFSMMGISIIGLRAIAQNKNDKAKLSEVFRNLFLLNFAFTIFIEILFITSIFLIPKLYIHKEMMYIGSCKILFNLFLIEWFFKGTENFRYITVRTILIKIVYVFSVFLFVKNKNDYAIYYTITTISILLNALLNCLYASKFISGISFKKVNIKQYINPFFTLGLYTILTSLYTTFNVVYLGFIWGESEVGYYTTATKLFSIILTIFTSFTAVMLPRMSSLVEEGNIKEVNRLIQKSFTTLFTLCFPMIIVTIIFAPNIIYLIAGNGYEGAILPMQIIMPLILIIGLEQIFIVQLMMPFNKDKYVLRNSIYGGIIGISLNIVLVPTYKSVGSSFVWLISEISILFIAQHFVKKNLNIIFPVKLFLENLLYALPILGMCIIIKFLIDQPVGILPIITSMCIIIPYIFAIQIYKIKDKMLLQLLSHCESKIKMFYKANIRN